MLLTGLFHDRDSAINYIPLMGLHCGVLHGIKVSGTTSGPFSLLADSDQSEYALVR